MRERVVLADDRVEVREALRLLLEYDAGMIVIGEAADVDTLLAGVRAACPDLLLLDWELPGLDRDDALQTLRVAAPGTAIIAISGHPEARRAALAAGVDAFISKCHPPETLLGTLREFTSAADLPFQ